VDLEAASLNKVDLEAASLCIKRSHASPTSFIRHPTQGLNRGHTAADYFMHAEIHARLASSLFSLPFFCDLADTSSLVSSHPLGSILQQAPVTVTGRVCLFEKGSAIHPLIRHTRLRDTHQQSTHQLTVAVSHVLDAMADASVKGLSRETIHEPLSAYLDGLKRSVDPYLMFQAAYAYQALLCVPDDEPLWQAMFRRGEKVTRGVPGLVSVAKELDLNGFIDGLGKIQDGLEGVGEIVPIVKTAYEGAASLGENGQGFLECLQEGLCFSRKRAWYAALRGADALIRDGAFIEFKRLVCEASCQRDVAFQWGICQRLGEIAANYEWNRETRRSAIVFLGEIYQDDVVWGDHTNVKQWIVSILMQLASVPGGDIQLCQRF